MRNVAAETGYAAVRDELAERLDDWTRDTDDPLLDGAVAAPEGALVNTRAQASASEAPEPAPAAPATVRN
ncbi:MAG: hypothetical protein QOJ69_484 [Actinomycetota bacterium]|jgi:hypothetical protein|nr:hypothetical protein [Actinomycetota bacterium]